MDNTPSLTRDELKNKLKQKLKGQQNSRKSYAMYESEMVKKEVPENLKNQMLEYVKYKKVLPFPDEMLKMFKDLSKDEIDKLVQQIQIAMKK
jgi:predicted Zn-dependent peptidase